MSIANNERSMGGLLDAMVQLARAEWRGTAAELLEALPADVRPAAPNLLSKRLADARADLEAAGVIVQAKRQAGTGQRQLVLTEKSHCRDTVAVDSADARVNGSGHQAVAEGRADAAQAVDRGYSERGSEVGCDDAGALEQVEFPTPLARPRACDAPAESGDPEFSDSYAPAHGGSGVSPASDQGAAVPPVRPLRDPRGTPHGPFRYGSAPPVGSFCSGCGGRRWWSKDGAAWACEKCCPDVLSGLGQAPPAVVTT